MELILIIRVLLRRWWIVLIPIVIVGVWVAPDLLATGGESSGFTTTFRYTAGQDLDALPNREGDYQDVWLASELLVNAFTEWITSNRFAEEVAIAVAERGLEMNPGALAIVADNERSVGQISLGWPQDEELVIIAAAVIDVLQNRNQAYFGPQLGNVPAEVTILDEPRIAPAPPPLTDRFGPLLRLALAAVLGVGLAFLVEYLDPTLRDRDELERLGLPIVGSIPRR
ncbi:MAG: hypothetical protein ACOCX3_02360 [Chloroflexota bacterium]